MGYRRPNIAATVEEMDAFSWSSPADAWPDRRALCPKGGQETEERRLAFLEAGCFEFFGRVRSALPLYT